MLHQTFRTTCRTYYLPRRIMQSRYKERNENRTRGHSFPRVYRLNSHPHSINFDPRNVGLTVVLRTATTIFLLPYSAVSYNAQRDMKDQGPYRLGFRSRREITFIQASCEA